MVDAYIRNFPSKTQKALQAVRRAILQAAPQSEETISYKMPAYRLGQILVYFAGYERHIGFYPGAEAIRAFQNRFEGRIFAKGSVQFPLEEPMPLPLIRDITRFRVQAEKAHKDSPPKKNSRPAKKRAGSPGV